MAETYDEQQEREWHEAAARITEKQLRTATEILARVVGPDAGGSTGTAAASLAQTMAINLSTIRRKR